MIRERVIYISNKELLSEIHKSKLSYCSIASPEYCSYDAIVQNLKQITPELIQECQRKRANQIMEADRLKQRGAGIKSNAVVVTEIDSNSIDVESLVFRVMTHEHIPVDPDRKRRNRNTELNHARTNFPPFKHYVLRDQEPTEVLRSHWTGSISNGHFDLQGGQLSRQLAMMLVTLVDRYSNRGNFRNYTYLDEMKSLALMQLSQNALLFDEMKSNNPFAFCTTIMKHCFIRTINIERRQQNIRDDILIMHGVNPSFNRQIDHEIETRAYENNEASTSDASKPKRGRVKKV